MSLYIHKIVWMFHTLSVLTSFTVSTYIYEKIISRNPKHHEDKQAYRSLNESLSSEADDTMTF